MIELHRQAFDRFLGPIVDINPDVPPEGTVSRGVVLPDRSRVLMSSANGDTLRLASFRRQQTP